VETAWKPRGNDVGTDVTIDVGTDVTIDVGNPIGVLVLNPNLIFDGPRAKA
jgi:hypothetical protein